MAEEISQLEVSDESSSILVQRIRTMLEDNKRFVHDAHGHLDREYTLNPIYYEHAEEDPWAMLTDRSLKAKQSATGIVHEGRAYHDDELYQRMSRQLERRMKWGVRRLDTCIDTTTDIGLKAFLVASRLKAEFRERKFDLRLGAYPLFGFKNPKEDDSRLKLFYEAAEQADFVCGLPERDDAPDRVGFKRHMALIFAKAIEKRIPIHMHVDQANDPNECGTESLIQAVEFFFGSPKIDDLQEPTVWAVHAISPSAYLEERFWKMIEDLRRLNIGVICCPRAAISMRQLRCYPTPIHNSLARVLEMLYAHVWVRFGSDNIRDVFVGTGSGNLLEDDIDVFADAERYYDPYILSELVAGRRLNETAHQRVKHVLETRYRVLQSLYEEGKKKGLEVVGPWVLPNY